MRAIHPQIQSAPDAYGKNQKETDPCGIKFAHSGCPAGKAPHIRVIGGFCRDSANYHQFSNDRGRESLSAPPPSEPRFSRIRLSSWWFTFFKD